MEETLPNVDNINVKQFARLLVGFWAFYKKHNIRYASRFEIEKGKPTIKFRSENNYTGFIIENGGKITSFIFESKSLSFNIYKDEIQIFNGKNNILFFKEEIGKELFDLFLLVSRENVDLIEDYDYTEVNRIFKYLCTREFGRYSFILGAGISLDYGIKNWGKLVNIYNAEAQKYLNIELNDILEKSYNTTYGSFQVVKDLNKNRYYEILENEILNGRLSRLIGYSTLVGIADVVSSQFVKTNKTQTVITMNYDSLLEDELIRLGYEPNYRFKGTMPSKENGIVINHIHGLIDKNHSVSKKQYLKEAMVLANDEYIKAYSYRGYAYLSLKKQLEETCIFIGNSITDYEEQKVIKNQFDSKPNSFHFVFLQFENGDLEFYRLLRLIKIGILPIYFANYNDMAVELNNTAKRIRAM